MADIKKGDTVVLAGTKKGLFILHSKDRRTWKTRGPYHEGYPVQHAILDPRDGKSVIAGLTSFHWGTRVLRSKNFGDRWQRGKDGPHYSKESGLSVDKIWSVAASEDGTLWAGVEPAGLFRSDDNGDSWQSVESLNSRSERKDWQAGGGGLCLHTILPYPGDPNKMVVAISAVGIFGTKDGAKSWKVLNGGIRGVFEPDKIMKDGEIGTCPHKLARGGNDPRVLYQQNHAGVYRRVEGDDAWKSTEAGLPRRKIEKNHRWTFGFPVVAHPHDKETAFLVPLESDFNRVAIDGSLAVYRTTNGARRWERIDKGLPRSDAYLTVLRDGFRADTNDPAGLYIGTTNGQVFASRNEGQNWAQIADLLPSIYSIEAGVVGG